MATIDSLIAAKRAKIASRVASESDLTDEIIKDLAQLKQAGLDATGSAPTVVDSASIGSGIDSSTDIDTIKALLTNILGELVNSKAFADVVVQDSVKTPFIRREEVDQTTGQRTIRIENFDGSLGVPVGAIIPIKNGGDSIVEDQYYAQAAGPGFSLGDSLSSLKVVDEARTVTLLGWFNITTQSVIAAPPTTAIKGYEDLIEELLSKLVSQLPASLGQKAAAQSFGVVLASDTALPLPLGSATALNQEEEILALEAIGSSVALAATESTLIDIENKLIAIKTNTLAPSIRPLSPATDGVTVESTVLATIAKQDEQKAVLDLIDGKLALVSTESTLLAARDRLAAIEANTLAPNSRPLTPAVDAVRVESATLATIGKQDEQKAVLDLIDTKLAAVSTATLQGVVISALNQILVELSKAKEFEDLIVQDTAGTAFIRREVLDESTSQRTITIENFDGTVGAPVGAVTTVKQIKNNSIVTRNYYAKVAGADFAAGDSLSTMQIVNGETNAVTMLGWFNITQQTSIAVPLTTAIKGYEDRNEELLSAIRLALPASLGAKPSADSLAIALASDTVLPLPINAATESTLTQLLESLGTLADISLPVSVLDEATDKGLLRLISQRIEATGAAEVAALGELLEVDVLGNPNDFGSLKAILRGFWQDTNLVPLQNALEAMLNYLVQPNIRPLVPSDAVSIASLPGSIQEDIAAIKANTARISPYQFQLVEDATGTVFVARWDTVTGVVANLTFNGSNYTPSGAIDVVASGGGSNLALQVNEFEAQTVSGTNWVVGDVLTRILVVNTTTGAVASTIWQGAGGATLVVTPLIGTDVIDTDKRQLALLGLMRAGVGAPADAPATTDAGDASAIAILKRLNLKFQPGAQSVSGIGVALPKKDRINGFSNGSATFNLLASPGSGTPTNVENYSSCELTLQADTSGFSYLVQTAVDPSFTIGVRTVQFVNAAGLLQAASGILGVGSNLQFQIDLVGVNFLRVQLLSGVAGAFAYATLNQLPLPPSRIQYLSPTQNLGTIERVTRLGAIEDATNSEGISAANVPAAAITLLGRGVATYSIGGTWVGIVQFQLSVDGSTWYNLAANSAVYDLKNKNFVSGGNITATGLYQVNVAGAGFVRAIAITWTSGAASISGRASAVSSLVAIEGQVSTQIINTSLPTQLLSNQLFVEETGTITASTVNGGNAQSWGISRMTEVVVTAISGTGNVGIEIQEAVGTTGATWRTIYKFPPINAVGVYRSPLLASASTNWRHVETLNAVSSFTRTHNRIQSNLAVPQLTFPSRTGRFNLLNTGFDLPLIGRTRRIVATNNINTVYFLQVHNSSGTAVPNSTVPLETYRLNGNSTFVLGAADLGTDGTVLGQSSPRLTLSTSFATYTPLSAVAANSIGLFVEHI
jgi:hypothetical protein